MRANANANDPASWSFWSNIHQAHCPHGIPYFLAWHRGFIYRFEQQLRNMIGNSAFRLPYWDYYKNPAMPVEFTNPSPDNPLYVPRMNTNVISSLSLAPFSLVNFQRGTLSAFESSIEPRPHGQIHNIIGGYMAGLNSPSDPIFWLHHSELDRLVHVWVLSGSKRYPSPADPYWGGTLAYGANLDLARSAVYNPATLGYSYQDTTLPTSLSPPPGIARPSVPAARVMRAAWIGPPCSQSAPAMPRPRPLLPETTGHNRRSIGGICAIELAEATFSVRVPVQPEDRRSLEALAASARLSPFGSPPLQSPYRSMQLVLDGICMTSAGERGGYFYEVYVNLPQGGLALPASAREAWLVGSFGAYEISAALHHGAHGGMHCARLAFPATRQLQNLHPTQLGALTVSFVRIAGESSPRGMHIALGALRIELSGDEVE